MNAVLLLQNQVRGIHTLLAPLLDRITPGEWNQSIAPGQNPIGFLAWHMVATRDWALNPFLNAVRPIGWQAERVGPSVGLCPIPFGMSLDEARAVATATTPAEVAAYSEAVTSAIVEWLGGLEEGDLDAVRARRDHVRLSPRYAEAAYALEIEDETGSMYDYPVWQLVAGACVGHCRGHLAEIDLALAVLRQR